MERVDQATYEEIKAGQIDGVEAQDIADQVGATVEQVQEVMRAGTWKQYKGGFTPKTTVAIIPKSAPSQEIRSMLGEKYSESNRLVEHRDALSMQVRGLMCAVRLLEKRKYDLEQAILRYESYLNKALKMLDIDALEEGVVDFSRPNQ